MTNSDIFKNTVFDHINPLPMLLCSVVAGILLGMMLDVFSLTERFFGKNRIIIFFTDMISVVFSYLFLFVCAYNFNCGMIRWYCVVISLGALRVQRRLMSKPFLKLCGFLISTVEKTLKIALKILYFPIKRLFGLSVFVYRKAAKKTLSLSRKRAYLYERNKIAARAADGFGLVPRTKEEKEWKRTERTNRLKKLASPPQ